MTNEAHSVKKQTLANTLHNSAIMPRAYPGVEAFVPTACAPVQHMLTSSHDAFPTARSRASCQRSRETIGAFCPVGVNSYGQHSAYVVGATARRWPDARGTRRRTRSASLRMITVSAEKCACLECWPLNNDHSLTLHLQI